MQKYNLRLSDKEYKELKDLSVKTERSINELIREAIRRFVQDTLLLKPLRSQATPLRGFPPLKEVALDCYALKGRG